MKNQVNDLFKPCNRLTHDSTVVPLRKAGLIVRGNAGFTLVELIVVFAILGVLALLSIPVYIHFVDNAKCSRTIAEIRTLDKDITAYILDKGVLPDNLDMINRANLLDPWGNHYVYTNLSIVGSVPYQDFLDQDMNKDYDLYSKGKNGITTGDLDDDISLDDIVRSGDGGSVGLGMLF
ncbi:MAG: prepilin-type N-terminal cleavage/methylation domain-containing protein [Geobacteraceae bacterium]|nr:prepilin-type N-terminal cleavage/methylation domain-containing protein [Geobacteraceae bacterium]